MENQFKDKVVIVTGSSAGLGEAIALMFASRGASVTICGRDQDRLASVFDKAVNASDGHIDMFLTVEGDLTDQSVRKQTIDQTVAKFGHVDILVANAGIVGMHNHIQDETEAVYDDIMNTNLKSVYFLIQYAIPHLEMSKGNIVLISSIASRTALPNTSVYSMTKAALNQLTACLALDLGTKGIRVNSVCPGHFPTLVYRDFPEDMGSKVSEAVKEKLPLKDRVGVVKDVAEAVTFLASDAAGFITGEQVAVSGGLQYVGPFF